MLSENWFFREHAKPKVINFHDNLVHDARSKLMTVGMNAHIESENRYLAFLDYDDYMYSHAYSVLINSLGKSKAAIAFATVEMAKVIALKDYEFIYEISLPFQGANKIDLLKENFCPIHSYIVDTTRIDATELYFQSDMTRLEDYEFLLRIAGCNPCDFSQLGVKIGCYIMRNDGSNSTPTEADGSDGEEKQKIWEFNRRKLLSQRSKIEVKFYASDF
ncbi:hypothetical protein ACL7TT_02710 [Microbulbifer sp. 2304DJ12-6]|uniref:hypothetical protein n=1 Tax=Microbulbifer sp. 2304DJ12-6 TaxID=3233340 RepID=UPI0039AFEBCB